MQIARLLKTEKSILSINRLNTFPPEGWPYRRGEEE